MTVDKRAKLALVSNLPGLEILKVQELTFLISASFLF